jgi:hypothetical protein
MKIEKLAEDVLTVPHRTVIDDILARAVQRVVKHCRHRVCAANCEHTQCLWMREVLSVMKDDE